MMRQISSTVDELIRQRMETGLYASEDELLTEALQALTFEDDDLQAIQEGLDSVARGEPGIPVEEAFRKLGERYNIPELQ